MEVLLSMRNKRARFLVPFLTASLLVSVAPSAALAHRGHSAGKKPRGIVTSFDVGSMALVIELRNGDVFEGTVDPDVQVKVEHRGDHTRNGNPSRGSVEDIVPGAMVLRMKFDDEGEVDRLRLRPPKNDDGDTDEEDDDVGTSPWS
jgi:hypothetical protein